MHIYLIYSIHATVKQYTMKFICNSIKSLAYPSSPRNRLNSFRNIASSLSTSSSNTENIRSAAICFFYVCLTAHSTQSPLSTVILYHRHCDHQHTNFSAVIESTISFRCYCWRCRRDRVSISIWLLGKTNKQRHRKNKYTKIN